MQKLKTIFLTISLLQLQACGKKQTEDDSHLIENEKRDERSYNPATNIDFDGDFIPNHLDLKPFIADNPANEIKLSMRSDQFQTQLVDFKSELIDRESIINVIGNNFRDLIIPIDLIPAPMTQKLKLKPNQQAVIDFSLQTIEQIENLQFEVKAAKHSLLAGELNHSETFQTQISSHLVNNKKLKLNIINFNFEREGKTYSFKELQENLSKKTYRVSIIAQDQKFTSFQVAHKIGLTQALEKIGYSQVEIQDFTNRSSDLFTNDLQRLNDSAGSWVSLNYDKTPKAGTHIIFIYVTAKDLKNLKQPILKAEEYFYQSNIKLHIRDRKFFKFKLSGLLDYTHTSQEVRTGFCKQSQTFTTQRKYIVNHTSNKLYQFNSSNILDFVDIYLDGRKVNSTLKQIQGYFAIENLTGDHEIQIILNNNFPRSAIKGISKPSRDYCLYDAFYADRVGGDHKIKYAPISFNPVNRIEFKVEQIAEPLLH